MKSNLKEEDKRQIVERLNKIKNDTNLELFYKISGFRLLLEYTFQSYLGIELKQYKLHFYNEQIKKHPVLFKKQIRGKFEMVYNYFGSFMHPNYQEIDINELQKKFDKLVEFLEIILEISIENDTKIKPYDLNTSSDEKDKIESNVLKDEKCVNNETIHEEENDFLVNFLIKFIGAYKKELNKNHLFLQKLKKNAINSSNASKPYKNVKFDKRPW